jgi:hypothetical protein
MRYFFISRVQLNDDDTLVHEMRLYDLLDVVVAGEDEGEAQRAAIYKAEALAADTMVADGCPDICVWRWGSGAPRDAVRVHVAHRPTNFNVVEVTINRGVPGGALCYLPHKHHHKFEDANRLAAHWNYQYQPRCFGVTNDENYNGLQFPPALYDESLNGHKLKHT